MVTVTVADFATRFAGRLPSSAAPEPVLVKVGVVMSRLLNAVHPVPGVFASVIVPAFAIWYSKKVVCATGVAAPPSRHSSPL